MVTCGTCGVEAIAGKRFCADCGAPLSDPLSASPGAVAGHDEGAQRRQLSVLFCDVVGSTALSAQLDPEDYRDLIRSYQRAVSGAIERFDGYIAQYLGDGILAYFGYPVAHEDDPHRAIRAGLAMIERVGRLQGGDGGGELAIRVGIHTGLVVVGEMGTAGRPETLAMGDAPNVAARVQALASPGELLATGTTVRLVDGLFELEARGHQQVKGLTSAIDVHRVLAERARSRFDLPVPTGIQPLVGRHRELATLRDGWSEAVSGRGSATLLSGEAGLGKSRLVLALREDIGQTEHIALACRCSPTAQNTELYPIAELLVRVLGFAAGDSAEERWGRIQRLLPATAHVPETGAAMIAELLGVDPPESLTPSSLAPNERRERLLEALVAWLLESSRSAPLLLVVEDAHWADPTSLELFGRLVDRVSDAAILCLLTARPDPDRGAELPGSVTEVRLAPLTAEETEDLAKAVAGGTSLPPAMLESIAARTDGVPLFVEELTRAIVESDSAGEEAPSAGSAGSAGPRPTEIPATLQGSLMARLDRLDGARDVAQVAAVIGRDFTLDLLSPVIGLDRIELEGRLAALVAAGVTVPSHVGGSAGYSFRHALIQEAAYESLLKSARRHHHGRIAEVLEARFRGSGDVAAELLARHLRASGQPERAIEYLEIAGRQALERFALRESVAHYRAALELVRAMGGEGSGLELRLQLGLGAALVPAVGYTHPDVERTFARAAEICTLLPDAPELLPALYGIWVYDVVGGRLYRALETSERMVELARATDGRYVVGAEGARAFVRMYTGRPAAARAPMEAALDAFDRGAVPALGVDHNHASFRSFLAVDLWLLGLPEEAAKAGRRATELAEAMNDPATVALVCAWQGVLEQLLGDDAAAAAWGQRAVAVSEAHGVEFWKAAGALVVTSSLPAAERIPALTAVLAGYRGAGARLKETHFLLRLAEAYRATGQAAESERVVIEALAAAEASNERWLEPELLRLRGELAAAGSRATGEAVLRRALAVAGEHGSLMLELRCATSLARHRLIDGRSDGVEALREVVRRFAPEQDFSELAAARLLVAEMPS